MFPKKKRLKKEDFPRAMRGRRVSSLHFSGITAPDSQGVAVVISKKVARLSVARHKLKRRTVAALKTLSLPSSLILFPKSSVQDLTNEELQKELKSLLSKIHE